MSYYIHMFDGQPAQFLWELAPPVAPPAVKRQGLWLIDVLPTVCGHVQNHALFDLPNGFVEILQLKLVKTLETNDFYGSNML